ncbi:CHAP domain-containing protein [Candidatus Saccharibacteria bacterium]|nr:CHAP domain-containing protein [Candidatus Saccharibacteria bacterium]
MRFLKTLQKTLYILTVLIILFSTVPKKSYAITKCDLDDILNGWSNYDSCIEDSDCTESASFVEPTGNKINDVPATVSASNTDYAGRQVITDAQLKKIEENAPFYKSSADKYDLPWQILAVIHIRESSLGRTNPKNGQGIYQFLNKNGGPYPAGPVNDAEYQRQTDILASSIKTKYLPSNYSSNRTLTKENATPETIKDLFFSYNGRASKYSQQATVAGYNPSTQGYEGSPYVVNKIDAKRDPESNKTSWGQVKRDHGPIEYPANKDYGAFVMYAALSGVSLTSSSNGTTCADAGISENAAVRDKIVALAQQELALWQNGTLVPGSGYKKYSQGRSENWCADFTSWIYNQAGVPLSSSRDGNVAAVSSQMDIGQKNGRFHPKNGYTPKPGDIVIRKVGVSHVNLVISVTGTWPDGNITTIGGNQGGGRGGFNNSKVSQYSEPLNRSQITGYVSPE